MEGNSNVYVLSEYYLKYHIKLYYYFYISVDGDFLKFIKQMSI